MPAPQAGHWQQTKSPAPEVCILPNGGKHSSLSLMKKEVGSDAVDNLMYSQGIHLSCGYCCKRANLLLWKLWFLHTLFTAISMLVRGEIFECTKPILD